MVTGAQVKGVWVRVGEGDMGYHKSGMSSRRPRGEKPGVRGRAECKLGAKVGLIAGLLYLLGLGQQTWGLFVGRFGSVQGQQWVSGPTEPWCILVLDIWV